MVLGAGRKVDGGKAEQQQLINLSFAITIKPTNKGKVKAQVDPGKRLYFSTFPLLFFVCWL